MPRLPPLALPPSPHPRVCKSRCRGRGCGRPPQSPGPRETHVQQRRRQTKVALNNNDDPTTRADGKELRHSPHTQTQCGRPSLGHHQAIPTQPMSTLPMACRGGLRTRGVLVAWRGPGQEARGGPTRFTPPTRTLAPSRCLLGGRPVLTPLPPGGPWPLVALRPSCTPPTLQPCMVAVLWWARRGGVQALVSPWAGQAERPPATNTSRSSQMGGHRG